ncbi:retrovirus-related pol polyprotein from transposon TNT 1-94 [Tanacetum coccineum]
MPSKDVKLVVAQLIPQLITMILNGSKECDIRNPIWYLDSGCSRHMTGVKSYLHKYVEQPGPKVVFGDDSTCITEGYGSIKCNGIVFTKVAFVNGLKYNLTSISQLCDSKYIVQFDEKRGTIFNSNKEVIMIAPRVRDVYVLDMASSAQEYCFFVKSSDNLNWLWHKRLAHLNFKTINKLAKQNLIVSLPSLVYSKDKPCSSCEKGKHHRANFKTKQTASIKKCLHLLHMDLFRPVTPRSINHDKYTLVIVDKYSRKNRTLIEAARTMLLGLAFSKQYWTEAVATTCYTQNRSIIMKRHLKTPYEIFCKRIPNINFLHVFGCPVYIHNHKDHLGKFDEKANDGYLLGYSLVSKAFRVFNTRRQQTEETYHIIFDESTDAIKFLKPSVDNINIAQNERYPPDEYLHPYEPSPRYQTNINDVSLIEPYECPELVVLETKVSYDQNGQTYQNDHNDQNGQSVQNDEILNDGQSEHLNHTNDEQIIVNLPNTKDIQIPKHLSSLNEEDTSVHNTIPIPNSSLSIPSMVTLAPQDRWSQEKYIELVNIIGNPGAGMLTRAMAKELSAASAHEWVFRNKRDETGIVIKNNTRLVAQGYNQQEGIDYDETFAPVARLETIRIFLAFTTYMNFIVYQMDVKSEFLNGKQKEDVYVKQPPGFESSEFPNHIKQSERGISINQEKYVKAVNETQYRGMIGSLMCLTTSRPDIQFLTCLCARYQANHKESYLIVVKRIFRCNMDRKSTLCACQLLRGKLVCWSAKKQQFVAMSSAKTEYVAVAGCCDNILWMKSQLTNYDIIYEKVFSVLNWALKSNQHKGPPFIDYMKAIYNIDVLVDSQALKTSSQTEKVPQSKKPGAKSGLRRKQSSKHTSESQIEASKSKIGQSDKETQSSLAKDKIPSHHSPSTPVVSEIHKKAQQAAGGPTSLGATSEEGAHPQLISGTNPSVLVDKTKFARDGLKTAHTDSGTNKESRADENSKKIKLEDLSNLIKDTRSAFLTPDSPQDEPVIVSNESKEDETVKDRDTHTTSHDVPEDTLIPHPPYPKSAQIQELMAEVHLLQSQKEKLEQQKAKDEAEVASLKASPSYADINQLTELLVTSLKPKLSKLLASHDFASSIPNELKELPSKIIALSGEIQELKRHVQGMEIELPSDLNDIPTKLETFTSTVSSLMSQTLDSLPSLLNKVTNTLTRYASIMKNASKGVPSTGPTTASPAEGEKNTNPATKDTDTTNLHNELIDLLGIDIVTQYYNKELLYEKYYDKMLKRRKSSKIINCDVLTQKGHITIQIYREDETIKVIPNVKVSDLHLAEWREELKIDFNKPLKEQDPLNELNDLANKKRKRIGDLKDHSRSTKKHKSPVQHEKEFESLKVLQRQLLRSLEDWEVSSLQFV